MLLYVIGHEQHSQPADPSRPEHFHAYLKFGKKIDISDRHHTTIVEKRVHALVAWTRAPV